MLRSPAIPIGQSKQSLVWVKTVESLSLLTPYATANIRQRERYADLMMMRLCNLSSSYVLIKCLSAISDKLFVDEAQFGLDKHGRSLRIEMSHIS